MVGWRLLTYSDLRDITGWSSEWIRVQVQRGVLPERGYLTLDLPRWDPEQVRQACEGIDILWPPSLTSSPQVERRLTAEELRRVFGVSRSTLYSRQWFQRVGFRHGNKRYWALRDVLSWWNQRLPLGRAIAA